jgi:hypothetical protein
MNIASHIDALERSVRNLPTVLFEWPEIDADLRAHYGDALVELLATHDQARRLARQGAEQMKLAQAWSSFVCVVCNNARTITKLMDVNPFELLAPSSVSAEAPATADALGEDEAQLGQAA